MASPTCELPEPSLALENFSPKSGQTADRRAPRIVVPTAGGKLNLRVFTEFLCTFVVFSEEVVAI